MNTLSATGLAGMNGADNPPLRVQFFTQGCYPQGTYFRSHNLAIGLTELGHQTRSETTLEV